MPVAGPRPLPEAHNRLSRYQDDGDPGESGRGKFSTAVFNVRLIPDLLQLTGPSHL